MKIDIWSLLDRSGAYFLQKLKKECSLKKPYQGLKIYHNIPLSVETCAKIDVLLEGGAQVVVRNVDFAVPQSYPDALAWVKERGLEIRQEIYAEEKEFDCYLDCAAELRHLPAPNLGVVELTGTGAKAYKECDLFCPVISVDDSELKKLETFYGTGEAFFRSFENLSQRLSKGLRFAVLGYGKVGRGIACYGLSQGLDFIAFDIHPAALRAAEKDGIRAYGQSFDADILQNVDVFVAATGVQKSFKHFFNNCNGCFDDKILCNMGAVDELSGLDASLNILADGMPVNFTLRHPTIMRYLDPSFYAHNLGITLLAEGNLENQVYPFPENLDQEIISEWQSVYGESLEEIKESVLA